MSQKPSLFTAAALLGDADGIPVIQSGNNRLATFSQLIKRIAGNSGAAGEFITIQVLTADATANTTTTLATVMTTTDLAAGVWFYQYYIVYQSATTTVGVNFAIDSTATVTRTRMTRMGQTGLATAADGIADQVITGLTGGVAQAWAGRSDAANLGPSTGVDTVNVDEFESVYGTLVTSTTGDLLLRHASETATSTQVRADTWLWLVRLN